MTGEGPAWVYYGACVGRWRAPLQLRVTDGAELRRSGLGLVDRLSLRLLAAWPRWLATVWMETSIAIEASGVVVHTTMVRWLGLPLQQSIEQFKIEPDGASITISGGMQGNGRVREDGASAEYELRWLGASIRQTTQRTADHVTVHVEGPGFRGVQELDRQP